MKVELVKDFFSSIWDFYYGLNLIALSFSKIHLPFINKNKFIFRPKYCLDKLEGQLIWKSEHTVT